MLVHYGHLSGKNKNIHMEWRGSQRAVSIEDVVCRLPATCQDVPRHTEGALGQAGLSTCAGHLSSVSPARQHGTLLCSQKNGLWIWYLKEVEGGNRKRLTGKTNSPGGWLSAEQTSVWVTAGYAVWGPYPPRHPG